MEHFERLLSLIEVEREAEKEENKRELEKFPVAVREALGKTVRGLVIEKADYGVGGYPLLILSRHPAHEELSPFHAMNQGDLVMVRYPPDSGLKSTDGVLYDVQEYRVSVALNGPAPDSLPGGKCQIDLLGSDATYQRMKKALLAVQEAKEKPVARLKEVFFGKKKPQAEEIPGVEFFNPLLNSYQREAVSRALSAKDVALVHGPPGTGKTTVLVEIIRQAALRGQRILASAPSNIAVDNMLEKLLPAGLKVVRLGHPARILESLRHATLSAQVEEHPDQKQIRDLNQERERLIRQMTRKGSRGGGLSWEMRHELQRHMQSLWREARHIERGLSQQILDRAQVILATHGGISRPVLKKGFDVLIMDEASQATEPLSWVPIQYARKVVFAGDPLQLPPTIYSEEAAKEGLAVTLFERLQKTLPEDFQVLLRVQYRMHEAIMEFSSRQFYGGKLEAHDSVKTHTACELKGVEETGWTKTPLVYLDTAGAGFEESWNELLESRENAGEADFAVKVLRKLQEAGLRSRDMALLTPYVAQVKRLKSLVRDSSLEIGTVDGFQGREKEVVVLSLVRSNNTGEVGFLGDTRRMNVAMTRARRLLIVIGDSATISRHPFYDRFIDYADERKAHQSVWEHME